MVLRIISFCLEKIDLHLKDKNTVKENHKSTQLDDYKFIDLFLYTFYPTFFFVAPFIPYENFYLVFVSYLIFEVKEIIEISIFFLRIRKSCFLINILFK